MPSETNMNSLFHQDFLRSNAAIICLVLVMCFVSPMSKAFAADGEADGKKPAAKTTQSNEPSLDDLLKLENNKPANNKDDQSTGKPDTPDLKKPEELTDAQAADAFANAVRKMDQAASRLRKLNDPGIQTQRIQEAVLRHLDEVLAHAQQQQQQGQQGKNNNQKKQESGSSQNQQKQGSKPQGNKARGKQQGNNASQGNFSPGQADDPNNIKGDIEETRVEWGNLPKRLRDELDQSLGEKFSPIYQKLTEAYYRRLAEEGNKK